MTTTVDRNEAFAAERAGQIEAARAATASWDQRVADGKLVPIGNGQFRVSDPGSWDNGEVFTQKNGIAVPQSGLDLTTGQAALYSAVPAWHGLGTVIPGGISDVDEVLKLAGLDFDVEQRPTRFMWEGISKAVPGSFVNVRTDTGDPLGVVGKVYTPVQNRDGFSFLQALVDKGDAIWESAGATREGRRVFISMRLPETVTIDAGGINEQIVPFVAMFNSHDGQSPFQAVVTPWRPVCSNTERFAVRDAHTRWTVRHTTSATQRIEEARRTLGLSVKYYDRFAAEETQLAQAEITLAEVDALFADLWPREDQETVRTRNAADRRTGALREIFRTETGRAGRTAYAAERTVTGWLDNVAPRRAVGDKMAAARATAILEGSDDDKKARAHTLLLTQVNR
jgi:phage/plasmid-like protein (TIGR03299 family)